MIIPNGHITVLKSEQIINYGLKDLFKMGKQLNIFKEIRSEASSTDLAIVLGLDKDAYILADDGEAYAGYYTSFYTCGSEFEWSHRISEVGVRPVIPVDKAELKKYVEANNLGDTDVIEFGEYPQTIVSQRFSAYLEDSFIKGTLPKTGRKFHLPFFDGDDSYTMPVDEYVDPQTKYTYIRIKTQFCDSNGMRLSDGVKYKDGEYVWLSVKPLWWYYDLKSGLLISRRIVLSGLPSLVHPDKFKIPFESTFIYVFLETHFKDDITQAPMFPRKKYYEDVDYDEYDEYEKALKEIKSIREEEEKKLNGKKEYELKKSNPYGFNIKVPTQEKTIEEAMKSGIAVFLHGKSSDGKSARVKAIDPDCEIIYLRNASPESLNGKSVYNAQTKNMEDIKPTWLVDLEERCQKEPDKIHVLFLDEISNALPSIQGIAFNIVLDREVNGKWKLPENVRIVAAGNEVEDSLAANPIAEPLFNRFAHVYIKTTCDNWLKWAAETNIHPAIYAYIAYKKGDVLRSKYDGEKPNADPRKWEMASKMLYATRNPESLRALVGEDITDEFIEFCKGQLLTLDDVLNDRYDDNLIAELDTGERYATIIGLTQVDEENVEKVIKFTKLLGAEMEALFEQMWAGNDEERLEIIAGIKMDNGDLIM